jgi:FdhE protein
VTDHLSELLSGLEAARQLEPALGGLVDLQRELLETSFQLAPPAPLEVPDPAQARAWLQQGIPLLHALPVDMDWELFEARFHQVCRICARHLPAHSQAIAALERQAQAQPAELRAAMADALSVPSTSDGDIPDAGQELLSFVLLHTLRPSLQARAARLVPFLHDELWQQGYCPVCAGWPDLAYLEDGSRSRRLVCSRCDTYWRFPRVRCPFCGTSDAAHLAYYPGPEKKYRLYTCNHCRRYLKALVATDAGDGFFYPVERVLTLSMDLAAQEAGYC